jgi:hypothetical protein
VLSAPTSRAPRTARQAGGGNGGYASTSGGECCGCGVSPRGPPGPRGEPGKDGSDGRPGANGEPGVDGKYVNLKNL